MMHVVRQWDVVLVRPDGSEVRFKVNDDHLANTLRKLADLDFGDVTSLAIGLPARKVDDSVTSSVQYGFTAGGNGR